MTEDLLHRQNIQSAVKLMAGKGMAKRLRGDIANPGVLGISF